MDSKEKKKVTIEEMKIEEVVEEESNLKGDYGNVAILLFLYILQGIPLGISSAVRILLQNRGVSYKEQALFSLASYPFTSNFTFKLKFTFIGKQTILSLIIIN
jgi:PAT family acetyl-CoA transporter-like MFS transporter 1